MAEDLGEIFNHTAADGKDYAIWGAPNTHVINGKIHVLTGYFIPKEEGFSENRIAARTSPTFMANFYKHSILRMNLDGTGKEIINPESLKFQDQGPVSADYPFMRQSDCIRTWRLATRVEGEKIVIGYSNSWTGRQEWLFGYASDFAYRDWETDRKSTRLNSSHRSLSRMPSSA